MIYYVPLLFMTLLGSLASLFLKKATGDILSIIKNVNFYIGAFLYFLSAILNIWLLRYLDYSIVLPLTSLTYIWTMFFSYIILKENITGKKKLGIILIVFGALIISI